MSDELRGIIPEPVLEHVVAEPVNAVKGVTGQGAAKDDMVIDFRSKQNIYFGRLDGVQASMSKNLRDFIYELRNTSVDTVRELKLVQVRSRTAPGLWEEGGCSVAGNDGRALIITDAEYGRLVPVHVISDNYSPSSKHALFTVETGYHVFMAAMHEDIVYVAGYRIVSINADEKHPVAQIELEFLMSKDGAADFTSGATGVEYTESFTAAARKVAEIVVARVTEKNAIRPAYAQPYGKHRLPLQDYLACIDSSNEVPLVELSDLEEAYKLCDIELGELVDKDTTKSQYIVLITAVQYDVKDNTIKVWLYNVSVDKSKAKATPLKAKYILLKEPNKFRYIDSNTYYTWDEAVNALKSCPNDDHCIVIALRRMLGTM